MKLRQIILLAAPMLLNAACAGPTTPLGAVWAITPAQGRGPDLETLVAEAPTNGKSKPRIAMTPSRQVLHAASPLKVIIKDPNGDMDQYRLMVKYNGFDVTRAFKRQSRVRHRWNDRMVIIENPKVKLSATEDHKMEFGYKNSSGQWARARYEPPVCNAFEVKSIMTTGEFKPSRDLVMTIDRYSKAQGLSPAFFAGLVAQESSFDPTLVSWAKALGLTQVTSLAETEIVRSYSNWPRYPGISDMTAGQIKLMIMNGALNSSNEWRLDSEKSIRGGLTYARYLADRWNSPENLAKIQAMFNDPEIAQTKLVLASYNSGYSRVERALSEYGKDWMTHPELGEARKYVNKIFSYCNHFSESEASYATET